MSRITIEKLTKKQAHSVLRALVIGYDVLGDKRDWCQGSLIRYEDMPDHRTERCAVGAIYSVSSRIGEANRMRAELVLNTAAFELFKRNSIIAVNDAQGPTRDGVKDRYSSWRNVRKAYRWSIKQLEARLAA